MLRRPIKMESTGTLQEEDVDHEHAISGVFGIPHVHLTESELTKYLNSLMFVL